MPNAHVRHSRYITLAGCKGTLTQQYIHAVGAPSAGDISISFAPQVTWGPILDPRGQCEGSIAVQRGTDSVRAGYRLGRVRAGSIAVYLVLK